VSPAGDRAIVGVVTGLRVEARCLRGHDVRIACTGGSAERARSEAARLVAEGAAALVSFGLAGGLAPELRSGDLLLPESVHSTGTGSWSVDPMWRERVRARLAAGGLEPRPGVLLGSERIVATVPDKRALFEATGAQAVDMESHAVAAVATAAGLRFLVVRSIADPHDRVVPQVAHEALRPDGRVRLRATLGGLIRQPGALIALLRLGRESAAALATLRRAAALGGLRFGFIGLGAAASDAQERSGRGLFEAHPTTDRRELDEDDEPM
jgi:hopanoid-associated phosphorylase